MALHVWQATIVNERGDILSGATVEVRHEGTGALARIYSDSEGEHEATNPMAVAEDGFARFYTTAGRYRITAAKGGYSRAWRHAEIGHQYALSPAEIAAGVAPANTAYPPGDIRRYGAVGDGVTDDTAAINTALSVNQNIVIPETEAHWAVSQVLSLAHTKQCVYGFGQKSKIVQAGTNANSSVFSVVSKGQNEFHGLYVIPNETTNALAYGYGFYISDSDYCVVQNCRITDHRRGGVGLFDSNHCKVLDNWIIDSVVEPGVGVTQSDTGADIYLGGSCSSNLISGNHCLNGAGLGIAVQTLTAGDVANHNVIEGNIVTFQDLYGIMLYILNAGADTLNHTVIRGNKIDTVSGAIPESGGSYNYGAGIYGAGADHILIEGNQIRNTNTYSPPDLSQAPAAIGITGAANCVIANNHIEDPNYWGIACIQSTAYSAEGRGLVITGNSIRNCDNTGIYLYDCVSGIVTGNRLRGVDAGAQGIYIRQNVQTQSDDFTVADNRIDEFGVGIQFEGTINRAIVHDNTIRGNTGAAVSMTASFANVHDNVIVQGSGGDGIVIASTCVNGFCKDNYIEGGDYGIVDDGGGSLRTEGNQYGLSNAPSTPYSTSQWRVLPDSATPSVRNARYVSFAHTTAITNFTNGHQGQVITLKALASFKLTDGATIDIGGDFDMVSGDTVTLVLDGSVWRQLSRGDN
jgi:parallel beta-helix repeat protein